MNLLSVLRLRHAVKQYASRPGAYLQHAYGASECYSAGQIRAGVSRLRLNPRYIVLGYAEFLSEDVFASLATEMPIPMGYWEAREAFRAAQAAEHALSIWQSGNDDPHSWCRIQRSLIANTLSAYDLVRLRVCQTR